MDGRWLAAFLAACALEIVVFALVDPQDLQWEGLPLELSRKGVYTLAFFVFWGVTAVSSGLTALLNLTAAEVNEDR